MYFCIYPDFFIVSPTVSPASRGCAFVHFAPLHLWDDSFREKTASCGIITDESAHPRQGEILFTDESDDGKQQERVIRGFCSESSNLESKLGEDLLHKRAHSLPSHLFYKKASEIGYKFRSTLAYWVHEQLIRILNVEQRRVEVTLKNSSRKRKRQLMTGISMKSELDSLKHCFFTHSQCKRLREHFTTRKLHAEPSGGIATTCGRQKVTFGREVHKNREFPRDSF